MIDIALQLYTVRDRTANDMVGTIGALAEMGYRHVETAGYGNATQRQVRDALDANGMRAISAHISLDRFISEREQVLNELQLLGCGHAIVPWLAPERRTEAFTTELIGHLNDLGPVFHDAGIRLGYHNHEFEFERLDGSTMFDRIRSETDPALVSLQIDLGWAAFAGQDPVTLVRDNAGRVPLLHGKDLSATRGSATSGDGILHWVDIIAAAREAGTEFLIIENDHPADSLADAQRAFANMTSLLAAG